MRYLHLTLGAAVLLGTAWAQITRQTRIVKRRPEVEAHFKNARWQWIPLEEAQRPSASQLRTAVLPPLTWLKPSQDADTVPDAVTTQPDFAHDTLLANNAGQDIDANVSSDCHNSFFDSLYVRGAWLIYSPQNNGATFNGNFLFPPSNMTPDTLFYVGGGIAERYDINPCALNGSGNSIYIKGIATQILNNYNVTPRVCATTTSAPSVDNGDGVYTVFYQLRDTVMLNVVVDPTTNDIRPMSYPADTIAQVTKPISAVRIGWNSASGQCVTQVINRLERLDHAYFSTPVEITQPRSIYAVIKYELYTPGVDNIADTLFGLIGPAYSDGSLCLNPDTNILGRNHVLTPAYRQSTGNWIGPDEWYPQFLVLGYQLDYLLFPIIYEAPGTMGGVSCQTTGQVIRHGNQGFGLPYPNPAVDCIHLNLNTPATGKALFGLYTTNGQLIRQWERQVPAGEATVAFDIQDVAAGSYLLSAKTPYGFATFWVNVVK